jgi:hypothetical protein
VPKISSSLTVGYTIAAPITGVWPNAMELAKSDRVASTTAKLDALRLPAGANPASVDV